MKIVACVLLLASVTTSVPISNPVYPTAQYINDQQLQPLQLSARQPSIQYSAQPQYISSAQPQIYRTPAEKASTIPQPQHPPLGITQLLLPTAADKQVQKAAATIAGPEYAQQVQALQLQGLANQVQAAAQRRAQEVQRQTILLRQQAQNEYLQSVSQSQSAKPELQLVSQDDGIPQHSQPQEDYDPNPSYQFGFDVKDDFYTNYQNRKEQRDGNKISGSYSVVDSDGFLRTVTYTADPKEGFKAEVNRQPTNIVVKVPKPILPPAKHQQYLEDTSDARPRLQLQKQRIIYQYQ